MAKLHVGFLWHHHQPYYGDARTGLASLPWVRLHSIGSYIGMARVLQEAGDMRVTFNLVPSLVEQIQAYADGTLRDEWLVLTEAPANDLNEREVEFILQHFFSANRETLIQPHARYRELLAKRSTATKTARQAAKGFSKQDIRDLQVWASLAWFHPLVVSYDRVLRELDTKGEGYTEDDKAALVAKQREVMAQIVPLYKHLQDEDRIEIATSPYYHPILPLLCNMTSAREALPNLKLPAPSLQAEADAEAQVHKSIASYEQWFGRRPAGMWPPEGSVSPRTLELLQKAGIQWTASDSDVLARSQLDNGTPTPYEPYEAAAAGGHIAVVFRDHELSDLIGFRYAHMSPDTAVADFMQRLDRIAAQAPDDRTALVAVILDGENPWPHYPGQGVEFLRSLYQAIVRHPQIAPTTFSRYISEQPPTRAIRRIFSGSWIRHCFDTWIGNHETNLAWDYLAEARSALVHQQDAGSLEPAQVERAWEELYTAEGSDWFWWYGEDHTSPYDAQFDAAFRLHLRNVYDAAGLEPPDRLDVPIHKPDRPLHTSPVRLLKVLVDGQESSYFEWMGAGLYEVEKDAGAMQRVSGRAFDRVWFGFDLAALFIRIDFSPACLLHTATTAHVRLDFVRPSKSSYTIGLAPAQGPAGNGSTGQRRPTTVKRRGGRPTAASAACAKTLEAAIPFDEIGAAQGDALEFYVSFGAEGEVVQRAPESAPIRVVRPTEDFERIVWIV